MIRVSIDSSELDKVLGSLENKVSKVGFAKELDDIGTLIKSFLGAVFLEQQDSSGSTWIPSERALRENNLTLILTGRLRDSWAEKNHADSIYEVEKEKLTISSKVEYSYEHDQGVGQIPREHVWLPLEEVKDDYVHIIERGLMNGTVNS